MADGIMADNQNETVEMRAGEQMETYGRMRTGRGVQTDSGKAHQTQTEGHQKYLMNVPYLHNGKIRIRLVELGFPNPNYNYYSDIASLFGVIEEFRDKFGDKVSKPEMLDLAVACIFYNVPLAEPLSNKDSYLGYHVANMATKLLTDVVNEEFRNGNPMKNYMREFVAKANGHYAEMKDPSHFVSLSYVI